MPSARPIRDLLEDVGLAMCAEMRRLLDERGRSPLRSGSPLAQLLRSGEAVQVQDQGEPFGAYGGGSLTLVAPDYVQALDEGRRPGAKKIPLAALVQFIKERGLRPAGGAGRGRRPRPGRGGPSGPEVNRLAFMLQNAIYKNGIRGRHFLQPAYDLGQQLVGAYLDEQLLDGLSRELEKQITPRPSHG